MRKMERRPCRRGAVPMSAAFALLVVGSALGPADAATFEGEAVRIGHGEARTVVEADEDKVTAIGVVFTPGMLEGLPSAADGEDPNFPYVLPMPEDGPPTVVNHVVINWESAGHPPPGVYDVQHFDFHFYLMNLADREKVAFQSDQDSGHPAQQPSPNLVPAGYIVPPGTAVSQMGVHAVNPSAPEFQGRPFTATFIYGYYHKQLTFLEPMASLSFLKTKPSFEADIVKPAAYPMPGAYPSRYSVKYHGDRDVYEVMLEGME